MLITGKNLRLYYWLYTKSGGGPANLPEIEKEEYGYDLQPGQVLFALRYDNTNLECYFGCKVHAIDTEGLIVSAFTPARTEILVPWKKEFSIPVPYGKKVMCDLYIEPCEHLFEKNSLADIIKGNIHSETIKNGKVITSIGRGIWHGHGGWRTGSRYEENLKWYTKIGQQEIA